MFIYVCNLFDTVSLNVTNIYIIKIKMFQVKLKIKNKQTHSAISEFIRQNVCDEYSYKR